MLKWNQIQLAIFQFLNNNSSLHLMSGVVLIQDRKKKTFLGASTAVWEEIAIFT